MMEADKTRKGWDG